MKEKEKQNKQQFLHDVQSTDHQGDEVDLTSRMFTSPSIAEKTNSALRDKRKIDWSFYLTDEVTSSITDDRSFNADEWSMRAVLLDRQRAAFRYRWTGSDARRSIGNTSMVHSVYRRCRPSQEDT